MRNQDQSKNNIIQKLENLHWPLISLIIVLAFIGFLMLYSAGGGSFRPWLLRQMVFFIIFFPVMIIIALTNIKAIYHSSYFLYAATLILLIIVDISGHNAMGATRWVRIGPIAVQPSEIMKVFTVFALAKYFYSIEADEITQARNLIIPILIIALPASLIFLQPDLGTASILVITGVSILFLAGVQLWKFITAGILALISIPILWNFFLYDYQKQRVLTFLNPDSDPLGSGYNIIQSKIAIGSGGIIGKGYLQGTQGQLNFLPEKQTDFIFTMLAEEMGLIGSIFLIGIYMSIIAIGIKIATNTKHQFGRLLVIGIMNIFFLHMFINMAMVMGLIPVVGAPLPFISYGGTIVATMMIGFGLVLNIDLNKEAELRN